ncbi:MAG: RNA polymerase factor sigma-54 [Maricaulis sp.]|uniref:RNA polymerase factor sigma-54 n=1 Tax=Maricaulis sp. TaxID=1486257 RepID=UPI001B035EFB|nr:RNA polymerase factor sigma-54 [Maricaulis sp.]MBO6728120.1 RNA polymerase factor sigma-54 [Maricaulis sp.]MBO6847657.1 RNA polymerase factor sigma-54 [Maricaulis sp.]MBO6876916.1 RNA polymerase factor sigma-54 [Maricaulis sp.]MDM7985090.1 RNA polymerase factor sigma-54 [Maricaulis sp.]
MAGIMQKLDMRQGQSLVMTPQLQQAIKLLQLSNVELAEFVEGELERNPLLERDESSESAESTRQEGEGEPRELELSAPSADASESIDADSDVLHIDDSKADLSGVAANTPADAVSQGGTWGNGGGGAISEDYDAIANSSREMSLAEHLHDQLATATHDPIDRMIGAHLIDLADEDGYLRSDMTEIAARLGLERARIEAVLEMTQSFEPAGVMARDLGECLALQLREKDRLDPAMATLLDNLERLARHEYDALKSLCGVDNEDLDEMISEIRELTPKPGMAFGHDSARAVEPDVFIRQAPDGSWQVELNSETLPRVLVNNRYYNEIHTAARTENEKSFITECSQNASWLVKSLDQRARTILKVASEIVRQQDMFLANGVAYLRPLNLKTVADAIGMHESTVSRVTSNKFVSTPRGMFELKYFFTSAIPSAGGGEAHSAEAVRHRIKTLIGQETLEDVLSDDKLVNLLHDEGIEIARRTVAKYREALNIPSSVQRRRILKRAG